MKEKEKAGRFGNFSEQSERRNSVKAAGKKIWDFRRDTKEQKFHRRGESKSFEDLGEALKNRGAR